MRAHGPTDRERVTEDSLSLCFTDAKRFFIFRFTDHRNNYNLYEMAGQLR